MSEYVERMEYRERVMIETRSALKNVEAGRVIVVEEVMPWLENWGQPNEKDPQALGD